MHLLFFVLRMEGLFQTMPVHGLMTMSEAVCLT